MDLSWLDLGCLSASPKHKGRKQKNEAAVDDGDGEGSGSGIRSGSSGGSHSGSNSSAKNKGSRETSPTSVNSLNKNSAQIKKPSRKKLSPLGWFPRSKVEPYLKRKIKLLQEIAGMNSTLDQTLGDSNPHYTRVKREQMAAREAAAKAMEARKAAFVEASWCRILRAARIQSKGAEETLSKAEENAAKAVEDATGLGVVMYDMPDCPRKSCEIKLSSVNGGGSTTHAVTASFETAFEVDKEVAAAVKTAFKRLASSRSLNENELKEILRKISENPDEDENGLVVSDVCSGHESDITESETQQVDENHQIPETKLTVKEEAEQRKTEKKQALKVLSMEKLVDMMLERLQCLHEDELASLATIVATCGLSAALAKEEHIKHHEALNFARRMSSFGADNEDKRKQAEPELPGLDKFLVKHTSRLEREVLEAKNKDKSKEWAEEHPVHLSRSSKNTSSEAVPDLASILIKHSSKLEREIAATKRICGNAYESIRPKSNASHIRGGVLNEHSGAEVASLDKCLVKHMSKLEREVQEAKYNRRNEASAKSAQKENEDSNKGCCGEKEDSLEKILIKPVHRLEKEKMQALESLGDDPVSHKKKQPNNVAECESLEKVLVKKHVSRLEKEKMESSLGTEGKGFVKRTEDSKKAEMGSEEGGLGEMLVKHKSNLEQTVEVEPPRHSAASRRKAREQELAAAWGGMSLANSVKPHVSRLERDKAVWIKAEGEERKLSSAH